MNTMSAYAELDVTGSSAWHPMVRSALALTALISLTSACAPGDGSTADAEPLTVETPQGFELHRPEQGGYEIAMPNEWFVLDLQSEAGAGGELLAILEETFSGDVPDTFLDQMLAAGEQGLSLLAFTSDPLAAEPDDYTPTLGTAVIAPPTFEDLAGLEAALPTQIEAVPGAEVHSVERLSFPAGEAVHVAYTLSQRGIEVDSDYYAFLDKSWVFLVTTGDLTGRPNGETFRAVVETLKLTGNPGP